MHQAKMLNIFLYTSEIVFAARSLMDWMGVGQNTDIYHGSDWIWSVSLWTGLDWI